MENLVILRRTIIGDNCIIDTGGVVRGYILDDGIVIGNISKIISKTKEWAEKK